MNLYLVQHAEARQKEEDPERPLSEKGRTDIRKIAVFIAENADIQVNSIMHSGKTRAQETAEVLVEYLNPPEGIKEVEGLKPLDDPAIWAEHLVAEKEDIMLVGHLPYLIKLSAHLLCQDENKKTVDFRMGGVVCLKRDESGGWSVRWMVIPEILH